MAVSDIRIQERSLLSAGLRVLAAPIATANTVSIAVPKPSGSDTLFFDTEPTHMVSWTVQPGRP